MVNDNSLSDSVLIQIGVLEKDIKGLKDTLYSLEHSGESGRGYDRQVANIKNQIQQKIKQIQQFKSSINMNDSMEQLKLMGFTIDAKDDDATEHGSIETYGKEKETETMPLEKNPVQAQDAYTPGSYDPKRHEINLMKIDYEISKWRQTVANLKQRIAGLERMNSSGDYGKATARELQEAKRDQEAAYMRLQQALSMKQRATGQKDEAPADVKDTKADGDPETMTTQEAREYWNKYHNSDPILEDYPNFEAWYRESKLNGYIVDEEPTNTVKDSYDMLKLSGFIS